MIEFKSKKNQIVKLEGNDILLVVVMEISEKEIKKIFYPLCGK